MLDGANRTPFDLYFGLFGMPVRIHPGFWIMFGLLGWDSEHPHLSILRLIVALISILVHELGHALAAESFGWPAEIVLYHFGGYAFNYSRPGAKIWKEFLVTAAGPAAGLALCALCIGISFGLSTAEQPIHELADYALGNMIFFNLFLNILNLFPVYPLDGGQLFQYTLRFFRVRSSERISAYVSVVAAGLLITLNSHFGTGLTFLFAILMLENIMRAVDLHSRGM